MFDVSVIIPVYNRDKELIRAINSVVKQKCNYSIEVIVVDDCSNNSDDIEHIVKSFQDKISVRLIRHEINKHGGAARNTGIYSAESEFIALLDSDDEWQENKLTKCIELLKCNKDSDAVYSKLELRGKKVGVYPNRGVNTNENYMDYLLVSNGTIQTSTLVFKKRVFEKISFDETLKRFQDYDLVNSMQKSDVSLLFVNEVLVYMHDDDQLNRISNSFNPFPAEFWYNKIKGDLSEAAKANFIVKRIVHYYSQSGKKIEALKRLINIRNLKHVNSKVLLKELLLIIIPLFILNIIRRK